MRVRKRFLLSFLIAAGCYAGWDWLRQNVEMATLRIPANARDHYTRLFVVDDPPSVWIRAERPDRLWLEPLRARPEVSLNRGGHARAYRAEILAGEGTRRRVDELFRAKYGVVDLVSGAVWRRDSVPIRLEPR